MFFKKHIFFCTNQKIDGSGCGNLTNDAGFNFAKSYLQQLNLWGEGKFRASKAGCLGRCDMASTCVVYPDGTWYTYIDEKDVQEIIDQHLLKNEIVTRLKI